jgi:poly(3-hydroxybutyrate) depolymerase
MTNPVSESPDLARGTALYDFGETTVFAHTADPRFSYCLYVPAELGEATELVVMVHGTGRAFINYRDKLSGFGRWNNCLILCPLFPAGVLGDGNRDGFKHLREGPIRYDHVLLAMIEEVGAKYGRSFESFALAGYSGGGQFVNRFALLHARKLWAASIGAPGSVTLLDVEQRWWVGTSDAQEIFGLAPDLQALRQLPVQVVVGAADRETWEITHREGGRHWMPGANDAGRTRPERAETLQRSFQAAGVNARLDIVPNVAHDGSKCLPAMEDFLAQQLQARRAAANR